MARLPRVVLPGRVHLVVQTAREGTPGFHGLADQRAYRDALAAAATSRRIAVHAYGLGDAEVRLLITPARADDLAQLMRAVAAGHRWHRRRHGTGADTARAIAWAGRFRSHVVAADAVLSAMFFVESIAADAVSSHAHHAGRGGDAFLTGHQAYWTLGNTPFERERRYTDQSGRASR